MRLNKILVVAAAACGLLSVTGCVNGIKATDFHRYEVGAMTRAEPAQVISQQNVELSSYWPYGLGLSKPVRARGERYSQHRRGITYLVKLERTGETISVTQADDVFIPNGGQAWVQFGERIRIFPKQP